MHEYTVHTRRICTTVYLNNRAHGPGCQLTCGCLRTATAQQEGLSSFLSFTLGNPYKRGNNKWGLPNKVQQCCTTKKRGHTLSYLSNAFLRHWRGRSCYLLYSYLYSVAVQILLIIAKQHNGGRTVSQWVHLIHRPLMFSNECTV